MSANVRQHRARRERGQIIVIFALALVAIIAMVGLVLDGGSAFAQRRDEQSAADLARSAAANDYMLNSDATLAIARARTVAAANGYTHGTDGVVVNVAITTTTGPRRRSTSARRTSNNFASIVGMPTWQVATTAKAQAGYPGHGQRRRADHLQHRRIRTERPAAGGLREQGRSRSTSARPTAISRTSPSDHAWTNYGTGNVNTRRCQGHHRRPDGTINKTIAFGEYIGQHNNGQPHGAVRRHDNNLPARTSRSRSSTTTATSRAGRPSTCPAPVRAASPSPAISRRTS